MSDELSLDAPHDGWTLLPPRSDIIKNSFILGEPGNQRMRVAFFMRDSDQALVGRVWFGPLAEGPPKHAHGGSIAAMLDEAMGVAGWLAGHRVVAAKISVEYKKPVRLGSVCEFAGWVDRKDGKRVHTKGEMRLPDGTVCAASEGLFIVIDVDKLKLG